MRFITNGLVYVEQTVSPAARNNTGGLRRTMQYTISEICSALWEYDISCMEINDKNINHYRRQGFFIYTMQSVCMLWQTFIFAQDWSTENEYVVTPQCHKSENRSIHNEIKYQNKLVIAINIPKYNQINSNTLMNFDHY